MKEQEEKQMVGIMSNPNRAARRKMWKEHQKFIKKHSKEIKFLEGFVEENGLEALNEYLEKRNGKSNMGS